MKMNKTLSMFLTTALGISMMIASCKKDDISGDLSKANTSNPYVPPAAAVTIKLPVPALVYGVTMTSADATHPDVLNIDFTDANGRTVAVFPANVGETTVAYMGSGITAARGLSPNSLQIAGYIPSTDSLQLSYKRNDTTYVETVKPLNSKSSYIAETKAGAFAANFSPTDQTAFINTQLNSIKASGTAHPTIGGQ
jgi:hypothetical protein